MPSLAAERQFQITLDVNLDEPRQQSGANHLLEGLAIAGIRSSRQQDDAPEIEWLILGTANRMPDMKQRLERARHELAAGFSGHPCASKEVNRLFSVAHEHVFEHAPFRRRNPPALHRKPAESSAAVAQGRHPPRMPLGNDVG